MPGATVVIANVETGWTRHVVTDERGWYRATALTPGSYEVRARLQGFATQIRPRLTIRSGINELEGRVFGFHRGGAVQRGSLTASGSSSRRPSPGHRARL
jgi:hypothetical protein